jgi:hypothetical protein
MANLEAELVRLSGLNINPDWKEVEVREEVLAPLLRLLGYVKGTDYDIERERGLLIHPFLMVGRDKKVFPDYACLVRRKHFWVLEAKRPSPSIAPQEIHQAYFYAIHPEVQARFFAVCNGAEFALFDVHAIDEKYEATLRFPIRELSAVFPRLRELLGADRVRDEVASRALSDLSKVLESELRDERLNEMSRKLQGLVKDARKVVDQNQRRLRRERDEQWVADLRSLSPKNSPLQMARVVFEFTDTPRDFAAVFDVFRGKLLELPPTQLAGNIRAVASLLDGNLTSNHRVRLLDALLRLVPDLDVDLIGEVRERIAAEVHAVMHRFPTRERHRLLWRFEALAERVPYKVSFAQSGLSEDFARLVERKRDTLPEEDLVVSPPSLWSERARWSSDQTYQLFHKFADAPTEVLNKVCGQLEAMELSAEPAYTAITAKDFDGSGMPPSCVYFDKPLDVYRSVLCAMLVGHVSESARMPADCTLEPIETMLRAVNEDEYNINHADVLWVRLVGARGGIVTLRDPETGSDLGREVVDAFLQRAVIHRNGVSAMRDGMTIWGQLPDGRWPHYSATLDLDGRRVVVGPGELRK